MKDNISLIAVSITYFLGVIIEVSVIIHLSAPTKVEYYTPPTVESSCASGECNKGTTTFEVK